MRFVTEDQVRELLPMRDCIRLMREVFKDLRTGAALNQARRRLMLPTGSTLHSLAGAWGKYFGTKIYSSQSEIRREFFLPVVRCGDGSCRWLSSRRIIWGRSGRARRQGMRLIFWPRRMRRRSRSSAAGFRRSRNSTRFAKCGRSRMSGMEPRCGQARGVRGPDRRDGLRYGRARVARRGYCGDGDFGEGSGARIGVDRGRDAY